MSRREHLRKLILRRLLFYGRTTRPELVSLAGCRAATVFEAIDSLKAAGMVIEPERRGKKTGRRAPELECNRGFACFLGVDLRTDGLTGVVTDCCGDILEVYEKRFPSPEMTAPETREELDSCISALRQNLGEKWRSVRGIGFSVPRNADRTVPAVREWSTGEAGSPAGVWQGRQVRTRMEYLSRLPDAPESLFRLNAGDAFDGGFIADGRLFADAAGNAMNIGHVVIDRAGALCSCGGRGCLEAETGKNAVLTMVRELHRNGVPTELTETDFSWRRFVECSRHDRAARRIAEKVAENLGCALATVVALLDPETIVIGGELAGLGEALLATVRRVLEQNRLAGAGRKLKLELSALEPEDTARGAAIMMRDRVLGIDDQADRQNTYGGNDR